ncbi:MAG TPA: DUF3185 domain-containing protein [Terracidiphilus sp.]|jgi:thiamine monophosphate synthase
MKICGILIIIAGLSVILYGSFFYTPLNQAPDMGLIQVDESNNQAVRIPPIMGIAGITVGGGLIYFGRKQRG